MKYHWKYGRPVNSMTYCSVTAKIFIEEYGFTLKKARSRRYLAQTITDADYTDDGGESSWSNG